MNSIHSNSQLRRPFENATMALAGFVHSGLSEKLEPVRLARAAGALLLTGCSVRSSFPWDGVASYLIEHQQQDGGWTDTEETLWCLGYLKVSDSKHEAELNQGDKWLKATRLPCGGWGKTDRDQPRIPITALASVLVPDTIGPSGLEWLARQWEADLASSTQLTYKGAFFLLSQAHHRAPEAPNLVENTIAYLCREQEEDGGFGPWKGHPVGSDPWTTGIVLWGLSKVAEQVPPKVFLRAVEWLQSNQLPNGLWPYHYLDDGTSMALIGLTSVLPVLAKS